MRKKRHTPEQIIAKLREAEVALSHAACAGSADEIFPTHFSTGRDDQEFGIRFG